MILTELLPEILGSIIEVVAIGAFSFSIHWFHTLYQNSAVFILNFDSYVVIKDNKMGGRATKWYGGNILHCLKRHQRKPRMYQWRLLLKKT